jgi:hypothetical protein
MEILLALALPGAAAAIWARRAWVDGRMPVADLGLGLAVALGAASVLWSALLFAGLPTRLAIVIADGAVWLAAVAALSRWLPIRQEPVPTLASASWWPGAVVLIPIAAIGALSFVAASAVAPHGNWDAWSQWNLRARFLFRGVPVEWRNGFAPVLSWSHPDYPLLVPASVARLWLYANRESVHVPVLLAAGWAALTVIVAATSVARGHGASRGCLAAAAILACPSFVRYSPAQCADIPLALFMLTSFVALGRAAEGTHPAWWTMTGGAAALAAWTKNEGLAFFVVFLAPVAIVSLRTTGSRFLRTAAWFAAGSAPVLIVLIVFKQTLAPPSYFVATQSLGEALSHVFARARALDVTVAMTRELWLSGATIVGVLPAACALLLISGFRRSSDVGAIVAWPVTAAMLVVYGAAYLASPLDLAWQLRTSLDRVVLQLVPTIVWAAMMAAR